MCFYHLKNSTKQKDVLYQVSFVHIISQCSKINNYIFFFSHKNANLKKLIKQKDIQLSIFELDNFIFKNLFSYLCFPKRLHFESVALHVFPAIGPLAFLSNTSKHSRQSNISDFPNNRRLRDIRTRMKMQVESDEEHELHTWSLNVEHFRVRDSRSQGRCSRSED